MPGPSPTRVGHLSCTRTGHRWRWPNPIGWRPRRHRCSHLCRRQWPYDGVDNNCSGDESDATDALTWYTDTDGDSYDEQQPSSLHSTSGYVANLDGYNDIEPLAWTGAKHLRRHRQQLLWRITGRHRHHHMVCRLRRRQLRRYEQQH